MADRTGIEWTDASWNPVVGCSLVSHGCTNCYAMGQAARIVRCSEGLGRASTYDGTFETVKGRPVWTGKVALASDATLTQPLRWRRPRRIFVNSMGDLFHESVPDEWIDRVFAVMALVPQHTLQILTKRSARMRAYLEVLSANTAQDAANDRPARWQIRLSEANPPGSLAISKADVQRALGLGAKMSIDPPTPSWPLPNVWLGVSAEDQRRADERIPDLLATPAAIRFVSAEPLLGPIDFRQITLRAHNGLPTELSRKLGDYVLPLRGSFTDSPTLDWIIVGGESGPNARPMHPDWARNIRDQCAAAGTAFFFKQWGEWKGCGPGRIQESDCTALHKWDDRACSCRVGKARAGRLLDGVAHDAMPGAMS